MTQKLFTQTFTDERDFVLAASGILGAAYVVGHDAVASINSMPPSCSFGRITASQALAKPSEREKFYSRIREIWVNHGRPEAAWDALHDWDYYFDLGYRTFTAHEAFADALR